MCNNALGGIRMKKITRDRLQTFNNKVIQLIKHHGAVDSNLSGYDYKIETEELGNFHIKIEDEDMGGRSVIYSIYGRFEDVNKAYNYLVMAGGNIYNGKLNYHDYESDSCISRLETMLNRFSLASLSV